METELYKVRQKIQKFEKQFEETHGRLPNEVDISTLVRTRQLYEKYERLKLQQNVIKLRSPIRERTILLPESPVEIKKKIVDNVVVHSSPLRECGNFLARRHAVIGNLQSNTHSTAKRKLCTDLEDKVSPSQTIKRARSLSENHNIQQKKIDLPRSQTCPGIVKPTISSTAQVNDVTLLPQSMGSLRIVNKTQPTLSRRPFAPMPPQTSRKTMRQLSTGDMNNITSDKPVTPTRETSWQETLRGNSMMKSPIVPKSLEAIPHTSSLSASQLFPSTPEKETPQTLSKEPVREQPTEVIAVAKEKPQRITKQTESSTIAIRPQPLPRTQSCPPSVSENFVRINLKQKAFKLRKKGGTAKGKMMRDRREFANNKDDHTSIETEQSKQQYEIDNMDEAISGLENQGKHHGRPIGADVPDCPGHRMPCVMGTVKKKMKNFGRPFFRCSFSSFSYDKKRGPQFSNGCGFFMWADNTPEFVAEAITEASKVDRETFRSESMKQVLEAKSLPQLKAELRKRSKPVSGTKTDLVQELLDCSNGEVALVDALASNYHEIRNMDSSKCDKKLEKLCRDVLQQVFHLESFRDGQLWAMTRALRGQSSLLVQATGTGKSLCYQIPGLLLPGLTIVVSPLVSLMEDQVSSLPSCVRGAALTSGQSAAEVAKILTNLKDNRIKVLFVAPERLFTKSFQRLLNTPGLMPPVSLLCVDEAHCISSWSHNFRPAYLRLRDLLVESRRTPQSPLHPACVLAMTATASTAVIDEICSVLSLEKGSDVNVGSCLRSNLTFQARSIPDGTERFQAVVDLLKGDTILGHAKSSVIIYTHTKLSTMTTCEQLRAKGIEAVYYHGGMSLEEREKTQAAFMNGRVRVIVATVAFGMGIDKRDIRGIIHMGLPGSVEDYVQETGRAGRDGKESHCFAFFDADDARRRLALIQSEGIDMCNVLPLISYLDERRSYSEIPVITEDLGKLCDLKGSTIDTILVYLAQTSSIELLPSGYATVTIRVQNPQVRHNSLECQIAWQLASSKVLGSDEIQVDLATLAHEMHSSVSAVLKGLHTLVESRDIKIQLKSPCGFVRWRADKETDQVETTARWVVEKYNSLMSCRTYKLSYMYRMLTDLTKADQSQESNLETTISRYFESSSDEQLPSSLIEFSPIDPAKALLISDLKNLCMDNEFRNHSHLCSGKSLARVLHGIGSQLFHSQLFRNHRFWKTRCEFSFEEIAALGQIVIQQYQNR